MDRSNFLEGLLPLLAEHQIPLLRDRRTRCERDAEPLVSLDLGLVVAVDQRETAEKLLASRFQLDRFPHSLNVSEPGSQLRVQIQTDHRYFDFPSRCAEQEVLGIRLPVAAIEDVLSGTIWAAQDPERRARDEKTYLI